MEDGIGGKEERRKDQEETLDEEREKEMEGGRGEEMEEEEVRKGEKEDKK